MDLIGIRDSWFGVQSRQAMYSLFRRKYLFYLSFLSRSLYHHFMVDTLPQEKQEWLARGCLEGEEPMMSSEELKNKLKQYKKTGKFEGKMGDALLHLAAAKCRTPILVININDETHEELAHFVSPGDVFAAERDPNKPIIVVVLHHAHFESEIPTEEGQKGLEFLYKNCAEQYIEHQGREALAESGCKPPTAAANNDQRGPGPGGSERNRNFGVQPGRQIASAQGFSSDSVNGGGWLNKIFQISSVFYYFHFQDVKNHHLIAAARPVTSPCKKCSSPMPGLATEGGF